jgi:hypothetical protein
MPPADSLKLVDIAQVIRSKNAGPLQTTLDILFAEAAHYERALASPALSRAEIARRYGVQQDQVQVVPYAAARAVKIVLERPVVAGSPGDSDVYGAQQHYPLLEIAV